MLSEKTPYTWRTINRSANGFTTRDLWFKVNEEIDTIDDTFQVCLLIGTNDIGEYKDISVSEEYYRQILRTLFIKGYKAVFCGEVPPIYPDGHIFFDAESVKRREQFNTVLRRLVTGFPGAYPVTFEGLSRECYEDAMHFNEQGNMIIAESFSQEVIAR